MAFLHGTRTLKVSLPDSRCGGDGVALQGVSHPSEIDRYKFIQIEEVAEDGSEVRADCQDVAVRSTAAVFSYSEWSTFVCLNCLAWTSIHEVDKGS